MFELILLPVNETIVTDSIIKICKTIVYEWQKWKLLPLLPFSNNRQTIYY